MMQDQKIIVSFDAMSLFRPPVMRSVTALLDKALFSKTIPVAAASIVDFKNISRFRAELGQTKELLRLERLMAVRPDPNPELAASGKKCLLLRPEVKPEDPSTWSNVLQNAVKEQELKVVPYQLTLDYDYWTYRDIMTSVLPESAQEEIPVGFAIVGHIAHLNLKYEYLPYKKLIAQVILDKNPQIKTVINKIDDVGEHSVYRTFSYEVLDGPDEMNVEVSEGDCKYRFNYSQVYWNSKLNTEHTRLVNMFKPGEVVCDVMAGVGPFAIPAGKKGVFVWANDLNPASFASLKDAIRRNKVDKLIHPFCEDGHIFIHHAADDVLNLTATGQNIVKSGNAFDDVKRTVHKRTLKQGPPKPDVTIPPTINHFVMNLPATAIDFVGSFNGIYHAHESLFEPYTERKLPMAHVHCFSTKSVDGNAKKAIEIEICERISKVLEFVIKPSDEDLVIYDVRDVGPNKSQYCASFRIPPAVAFRERRI